MPFVEILAPPAPAAAKAVLARAVTAAIVDGFGVGPETVTLYHLPIAPADYAHAGEAGEAAGAPRIFVKIHAFRRDVPQRRTVAVSVTAAIAAAFGADPADVAVYFLDRARDEVAHAGHLASD